MSNYTGIIIEESLDNKDVLKKLKILRTDVEPVTKSHETPFVKQWTMHTVDIQEYDVDEIADEISKSLDKKHVWFADFKNEYYHYIIFLNKIFKVDLTKPSQYDEVVEYGLKLGVPKHQLGFGRE